MTSAPFDPSRHDLGYLLTAYADGQLAPEGVQWVDRQLAERPELKTRLDEIRALQQALRSGLAGIDLPLALDDGRRASVLAEAGRGPVAQRRIRFGWPLVAGLAAACLTVAVVVAERGPSAQSRQMRGEDDAALALKGGGAAYFSEGKEEAAYRFATPAPMTATIAPPPGAAGGATGLLSEATTSRDGTIDGLEVIVGGEQLAWKEAAPAKRGRDQGALARAGANGQPAGEPPVLAGLPAQPVQQDKADQAVAAAADAPSQYGARVAGGKASAKPAAPPPPVNAPADADRLADSAAYQGKLALRKQVEESGGRPATPATSAPAPAEAPAPVPAATAAAPKPSAQPSRPQPSGPALARREEADKAAEAEQLASRRADGKPQLRDEKAAKDQRALADAVQQDEPLAITLETDGLARGVEVLKEKKELGEATPREEAKLNELQNRLAERNQQRAGGLAPAGSASGRMNLRQLREGQVPAESQAEARSKATATWDGRQHDPATNRALLAERLSMLADSQAGDGALRLLGLAAGDADVVVEQAGLPLLAAADVRLHARDLNRGQAVVQVARGAGLQVRPIEGGALSVERPRGQLDPTATFGYDRETFRALFGSAPMLATAEDARSTFALDAETASYDRARALVAAGQPIDPAAIRPEQFINAMPMDYPPAGGTDAFTLYAEAAPAPFAAPGARAADEAGRAAGVIQPTAWSARTALVAIGVVARPAGADERRPLRLTLAIDCSGSMGREGGLARVQTGLAELVGHLRADDTVALVAFSDQARLVLPATPGSERARIAAAIAGLKADGATNAVDGLGLAYQVAAEGVAPGAESRVVLASDGATLAGPGDLVETVLARVRAHRERGVSLLVVGSGAGSYQAAALERLANRADGQQVFLGSDEEAKRIFGGRLLPERLGVLAKDAKVQVTWNPQRVSHARLIGYEQRRLAHTAFRDDVVDAGELSHDAQVTALYEVLLVDGATGPLGSAAVRYHDTRLQQVRELACPLPGTVLKSQASDRLRLLACAAETAEWLQRGWWSNVRLPAPGRILAELARCPQPAARELEDLVRRAQAQDGGKP